MRKKQIEEENAVWAIFQRLNPDPFFKGFQKSERPDFIKDTYGVELTLFQHNSLNSSGGSDLKWEKIYAKFSYACEEKWRDIYPNRPLPYLVLYIPKKNIRTLKNREVFLGHKDRECICELVKFVGSVFDDIEVSDEEVSRISPILGRYFQTIYVSPYKNSLSDKTTESGKLYCRWSHPHILTTNSIGTSIAEIVNQKVKKFSKYPKSFSRLDLIIYANGSTNASSLFPWTSEELRSEFIDPGCFTKIWLLDIPRDCLLTIPLKTP